MSQQSGQVGKALTGKLVDGLQNLISAAGERMASAASDKVEGMTSRLLEYASQNGSPTAMVGKVAQKAMSGPSRAGAAVEAGLSGGGEKIKQAMSKPGGNGQKNLKVTNIIESIDVGVPVRLAYNQWTQFEQFPSFMKKVESVEQESDEKYNWKAQVLWSHRNWESTIIEQVPDERIVWKSKGDKGWVDGAVSFHELSPDLTRILLVLQYQPRGFVEQTGNLWRAPGRRARLELKHFARHVMTEAVLHPDEVHGWRGEIRDGQVVQSDEDAQQTESNGQQPNGEAGGEPDEHAQPEAPDNPDADQNG